MHVFAVTRDAARYAAEFEARYTGPLCVTLHARSLAFLESARRQAQSVIEDAGLRMFSASLDEVQNVARLNVDVADPAVQADLDRRIGAGVVVLHGRLRPV